MPTPTDPGEIGVGNDIVAYYTAPIGYDFQKRIPVRTTNVTNWVAEDGDTPSGVFLDERAGVHEGKPDVEQTVMQSLSGYDASNNRIAKAEVHFDIRKPQGIEVPIKFFAHKGQYSYNVIPSPQGVAVERWDPWMAMPDGMTMRNEALEGAPSEARDYTLLWQGYDFLNRPVAFAHGDLVVTDGPIIDNIAAQHTDPARGQPFQIQAVSHNVISTPVYRLILVDGERPDGLEFDAETGNLSGVVEAFDWKATFRIRVTDTYDGTWDETEDFVLSTAPPTFSMDDVKDIVAYRGENRSYGFSVQSSVPGLTWSLAPESAPLPPVMSVVPDKQYAYISGIPSQVGEWPGIVLMASAPGFEKKTSPFKIIVREQPLYARAETFMTRTGQAVETAGFKILRGRADPVEFKFADPATVPAGMTIEPSNGVIKLSGGYPTVGQYRIPVLITNGDGQTSVYTQYIMVYPDLSIAYEPTVFTRYSYGDRAMPTLDWKNVAGTPRFTVSPALPDGLKLDASGRIVSTYDPVIPKSAIGVQEYVVSIQDDAGTPIASKPFTIQIKDRPDISVGEGDLEIERYAYYNRFNPVWPVAVENTFRNGSARYTYSGNLPNGLEIGEYGFFEGTTSAAVGDYPGITVTITDGDGQNKSYGPFTVRLKQAMPIAVLDGDLDKSETWPAGYGFKFQLPSPYNGKKPISWTLTDAPAGLSVDADGKLTGSIALTGTYVVKFDIEDDTGRAPVEGSMTLSIEEPFEFGDADWNAYKGQRFQAPDGTVAVERGIKPFTWTVTSNLPSGWYFYQGQLVGTPTTSQGGFQLDVTMKDKAGVQRPFSTFVKFNPPKPLSVAYQDKALVVGSTTGLPMIPKLSDGSVKISDWAPVQGLPSGIAFDTKTGAFTASPYPSADAVGVHTVNVVPRPADPEVKLASSSFPIALKVGYSGEIGFESKTFKERLGKDFTRKLTYSRAVEPVKMSATSLAGGISFNDQTFSFSGRFDTLGSHAGGSIKIEENDDPAFNRERISHFNFETVEDISLKVPTAMAFGQYDFRAVSINEIINVIGDGDATTPDVTYKAAEGYPALPEGLTINALSGAVEGAPDSVGTFGPFAITAFDAYGDSKNSNEFSITVGERKQLEVSYPTGFGQFRRYGQHSSVPVPINGYGPFTWTIDRALPAGIDFDTQTGTFTASSDQIVAPQEFTVTVVDSKGGAKGTATTKVSVGISERLALALDYGNPVLAFRRHVSNSGSEPTIENRVSRGGELEFSIAPVSGAALPSCIAFDEATGRLSTDPACTAPFSSQDYRVTMTDRTWRDNGNANGKAEYVLGISVQERPAISLDYPDYDKSGATFGFKRHQAVTVYPEWDDPITDDVSWSINPTPPTGISFNQDGSISVETGNLIPVATYVVTVSDDFDGESHLSLNLGVSERDQLAFSIDPAVVQQIALNGTYELTLDVNNVISDGNDATPDVFYSQVSGTLPSGIVFDADGTGECGIVGTFCGEANVSDHGKSFTVRIKATDAFNGVVEKVFTFTVVEDATPMKVTYADPAKARVGYAYKIEAPSIQFAVGNYAFSAPTLAQVGLAIDAKTGEIRGTPNSTFDRTFDVTVTDKLGAARAVTAALKIVSVPSPTVTAPNPVSILFNRDIPADQQPQSSNFEAPTTWTLDPVTPPPGLALDTATGRFVGKPSDIGKYGPYTLTLKDALPGTFPTVFGFDIAMNDDPIELEALSVLTKVGFSFETKAPEYDNALGAARFSSPELVALGLAVDPVTGVVSGSVGTVFDGKPNLVIRDNTIRTTSMPVNLTVLPRLRLTAPETVYMTAFETVTPKPSVTSAFAAGTVTWEPLDPTMLPVGVIYDNDGKKGCGAAATFCGTPLKAQTMDPITVYATDTFGAGQTDRAQSNPINIVVRKGVFAMEFLPDELPVATKRHPYSVDLVAGGMFEYDGMDLSTITFSLFADPLKGEAVPPGISVLKNGILSGTPIDEGTYVFDVVAKYSSKPSVSGKFKIVMELPETELSLATTNTLVGERYEPFTFNFRTLLTNTEIPFDKIKWEPLVALPNDEATPKTQLPADITMSSTGVFSGTPQNSGTYTFSVPVTFKDRTENLNATEVYKLVINRKEYKFKTVSVGLNFTCGVDVNNKVLCWGVNDYYQLGHSLNESATLKYSLDPREVQLSADATEVVAGMTHACALLVDGKVKCWGRGYNGDGKYAIDKGLGGYVATGALSVAAGGSSTCYINSARKLFCSGVWTGINGGNDFPYHWKEITSVAGVAESVSVNDDWGCAVTTAGGVVCFGSGDNKSSGNKPWLNPSPVAVGAKPDGIAVGGLRMAATSVVATYRRACASLVDGTVQCWGDAGLSPTKTTNVQKLVSSSNFSSVTLCAITTDGQFACNGHNPGNVGKSMSASYSHVCVVREDDYGYCAGQGTGGALGQGVVANSSSMVKVVGK